LAFNSIIFHLGWFGDHFSNWLQLAPSHISTRYFPHSVITVTVVAVLRRIRWHCSTIFHRASPPRSPPRPFMDPPTTANLLGASDGGPAGLKPLTMPA
jgi:hypothetical protein